ncbi:MAG: hypothetical protein IT557_17295 [Alphaproteobacteria bacterium]|nr:hypothetical protein [Alphaproteobacteria bacterium]
MAEPSQPSYGSRTLPPAEMAADSIAGELELYRARLSVWAEGKTTAARHGGRMSLALVLVGLVLNGAGLLILLARAGYNISPAASVILREQAAPGYAAGLVFAVIAAGLGALALGRLANQHYRSSNALEMMGLIAALLGFAAFATATMTALGVLLP